MPRASTVLLYAVTVLDRAVEVAFACLALVDDISLNEPTRNGLGRIK